MGDFQNKLAELRSQQQEKKENLKRNGGRVTQLREEEDLYAFASVEKKEEKDNADQQAEEAEREANRIKQELQL